MTSTFDDGGFRCDIITRLDATDLAIAFGPFSPGGTLQAWAGVTVDTAITAADGTTPAAVSALTFTTGASGVASISLTVAQKTTLGIGFVGEYSITARAGTVKLWSFTGAFRVKAPTYPATSVTAAIGAFSTSNGAITPNATVMGITMAQADARYASITPAASTVTVADAGNYLTAADLESALQEIMGQIGAKRLLTGGGESVLARDPQSISSVVAVTQQLRITGFRALRSESISRVRVWSGSTAAGATPTVLKIAVFSFDGTTYTQVATTPNTTSMLASANTTYTTNLSASFNKVAGTDYCVALVIVTAAALPSLLTLGTNATTAIATDLLILAPAMFGTIAGQADMPSSFLASNLTSTSTGPGFHCLLLP